MHSMLAAHEKEIGILKSNVENINTKLDVNTRMTRLPWAMMALLVIPHPDIALGDP